MQLLPDFERQTGHKVIVENDTVGALTKRIEGGEAFDVAVLTPAAVDNLAGKGKFIAGSRANLARVGVGVMVRPARRRRTSARSRPSRRRCWQRSRSPISTPPAVARAASMSAGLLDKLGIADAGQAQDQIEARRRCRGSHRRGRSRARHPSDQRDRAGERGDAGRAAAGGYPELHHVRGRPGDPGQGRRSSQSLDQGADWSRRRRVLRSKGMDQAAGS